MFYPVSYSFEKKCGRAAADMVDTARVNPDVEVYTVESRGTIRRLWVRLDKKAWIRMESDACKMRVDPGDYEAHPDWRGPLSGAVVKFDAGYGLPVLALLGFRVMSDGGPYCKSQIDQWVFMLRCAKRPDLAFGMVNAIEGQNGRPVESWDAACGRVMAEFMEERLYIGFGSRRTNIDQMVRHVGSVIGVVTAEQKLKAIRCATDILRSTGLPFDGYGCKHKVILPHERRMKALAGAGAS